MATWTPGPTFYPSAKTATAAPREADEETQSEALALKLNRGDK